jgi:hypothetical protein
VNGSDAYVRCQALFAEFPQAVELTEVPEDSGHSWAERSMVLMVPDGDKGRFFILCQADKPGSPFTLLPWRRPGLTTIRAGGCGLAGNAAEVLTDGIPVPRHGSLFGWVSGATITALIASYTQYTPQSPTPNWAFMPWIDGAREQRPQFGVRKLLGRWFWEYLRSGTIRDLQSVIATPDTVFWVDTVELLGSGSCVVAREVRTADGLTLPKGRYVYYPAALSETTMPSLDTLLQDPHRTDLTPGSSSEAVIAASVLPVAVYMDPSAAPSERLAAYPPRLASARNIPAASRLRAAPPL